MRRSLGDVRGSQEESLPALVRAEEEESADEASGDARTAGNDSNPPFGDRVHRRVCAPPVLTSSTTTHSAGAPPAGGPWPDRFRVCKVGFAVVMSDASPDAWRVTP